MSKEELNKELITAVIINDIKKVQSLIKQGANVNYADNLGLTPLHYTENKEIAKLLLRHGANVNQKADDGKTPLFFAKNPQIAQILINNGAKVNHRDNRGVTPLHMCESPEIAEVLINHGAKVNQGDNRGGTPLHVCKSPEIAEVLINHGANVNQVTNTGVTPLHMCESPEIAEVLINHGANVNQETNTGVTPLHWCNSPEMAEVLLNNGANVNQGDNTGLTALHVCESPEMAKVLINHGANVNQGDKIGLTALHHAQKPQMVQFLINNGANVNQGADDGRTPLFFAKNPQIAQILINNRANVNHRDNYGNTPLHYVTDIEIAKLLVASGADINHQNQAGLTPVTRIQDVRLQAFLIPNGAIYGTHKNPENQIHNRHPNTLKIPTGPEYGYSASPVTDREIRAFVNNDLRIKPNTDESKETMFKALKEVCRTPTGCMAFRATRANVKEQRKKNTNYHLDVTLSKNTDVDYSGCVFHSEPNRTYIQTKKILNSAESEAEGHFIIGTTFLHEAMHVRQHQQKHVISDNKTHVDTPTSALTRQIALESPYPSIRRSEDISDTERLSYERAVRLNKDGSYDAVAAQRYSAHMQQIHAREFIRKPEERPIVNYGSLSRQYAYLDQDIHARLLLEEENQPTDGTYTDLEKRFDIPLDKEDFVENQVTNALRPLAEKVKDCCSIDQREALRNAVINGNTSLSPKLFPKGSKAREKAEAYLNASNDISHQLILISIYSPKIQDDPDNIDLLQKSAACRRKLKEKYDITIPTHNLSGERVAENMDIKTERSSSTLDAILRQSEQNAVRIDTETKNNPPHDMTNATLASNSTHNSGTIEIDNPSSATKNHMTDKNLV